MPNKDIEMKYHKLLIINKDHIGNKGHPEHDKKFNRS